MLEHSDTPAAPGAARAADWAASLRAEDIPVDVRQRACVLLLDTLGVGIGAGRTPAAALAYALASEQFAAGEGTAVNRLPFDGRAVSAAGCAYAFATRIDNLDGHDGYQPGKGHAGVAILPALLAALPEDAPDAPGNELVTAAVAGYEIACRAALALHASAGDYHSSGAWNALGAAAAAGRLRGASATVLATALGIAEYHAPRAPMMREIDAPSMLHDSSGWGALAGVTGIGLALRGFAASPAELPSLGDDWETLGERWCVLEQYVKPHPVCFWAQPAVTAALRLRARHGIRLEDVREVRIETFHEATRLQAGLPQSTQVAQYALAFPVAAALARGCLGPAEVTGEGLADPAVHDLVERVTVRECEPFSQRFPAQRLGAVTIRLADGSELASGPTEPRGTPADPLGADDLVEKFHAYAEPEIGAERASYLRRLVLDLDSPGARARALVEAIAAG
jgi:2-methylcitrate dehydratase PrpD